MSDEVRVRPARLDELEVILNVWRRAGAAPGVTDDIAALEALRERQPDALLVALVDERVVGTVIATWDGWRANVYRLAVLPEHRRRSIARTLVAHAERSLREAGARRVSVLILDGADAAVGFWGDVGFEQDERVRRYVRDLAPPSRSGTGSLRSR